MQRKTQLHIKVHTYSYSHRSHRSHRHPRDVMRSSTSQSPLPTPVIQSSVLAVGGLPHLRPLAYLRCSFVVDVCTSCSRFASPGLDVFYILGDVLLIFFVKIFCLGRLVVCLRSSQGASGAALPRGLAALQFTWGATVLVT